MERSIKELLIILRDNSKIVNKSIEYPRLSGGLCKEALHIFNIDIISTSEYITLINYMSSNRPKKTHRFDYWWKKGYWKPRLKWLNEQINKL